MFCGDDHSAQDDIQNLQYGFFLYFREPLICKPLIGRIAEFVSHCLSEIVLVCLEPFVESGINFFSCCFARGHVLIEDLFGIELGEEQIGPRLSFDRFLSMFRIVFPLDSSGFLYLSFLFQPVAHDIVCAADFVEYGVMIAIIPFKDGEYFGHGLITVSLRCLLVDLSKGKIARSLIIMCSDGLDIRLFNDAGL